ncbi:MAG: hypothetical protein NT170_03225 [Candidatus Moranbacteria bacterium]|nr:hypothetical protein [Candidatus Moranbacteria bacterium]
MKEKQLSPIDKWLAYFDQSPTDAIFQVLLGQVYLGAINILEPEDQLKKLFRERPEDLHKFDRALVAFLEKYLFIRPEDYELSHWDCVLMSAFRAIAGLDLKGAQLYLHANYKLAWEWLTSLYEGTSRDPLGTLLWALALSQTNRELIPLWLNLCGMKIKVPDDTYWGTGILGLVKLPGGGEGELDPLVFQGLRDLADALQKMPDPEQGQKWWIMEVRSMRARYPHPEEYWTKNFSGNDTASKWYRFMIQSNV